MLYRRVSKWALRHCRGLACAGACLAGASACSASLLLPDLDALSEADTICSVGPPITDWELRSSVRSLTIEARNPLRVVAGDIDSSNRLRRLRVVGSRFESGRMISRTVTAMFRSNGDWSMHATRSVTHDVFSTVNNESTGDRRAQIHSERVRIAYIDSTRVRALAQQLVHRCIH